MRRKYTTALEEELIDKLKVTAIMEKTKPNVILEELLKKYFEEKESK